MERLGPEREKFSRTPGARRVDRWNRKKPTLNLRTAMPNEAGRPAHARATLLIVYGMT